MKDKNQSGNIIKKFILPLFSLAGFERSNF